MNRLLANQKLRSKLKVGKHTIGTWIQIPDASCAEIIGKSGYEWAAVDLEHGSISINQLPNIFRALELGNTLPFARISKPSSDECKKALDAGAAGIIVPMIDSKSQLEMIKNACRWPPAGNRGVGFSRANLYGRNFEEYHKEAQQPFLVAMIENIRAVDNLDEILSVDGLDAILIGPYDLSASMGITGDFCNNEFKDIISLILTKCLSSSIPAGIHIVSPDSSELRKRIDEGFRFLPYSIDSVFMRSGCQCPEE